MNNIPIISSSNCGAVNEIKETDYNRINPSKIELGINQFKNIIQNPTKLPENLKGEIFHKYSIDKIINILR